MYAKQNSGDQELCKRNFDLLSDALCPTQELRNITCYVDGDPQSGIKQ